MSKHLKRNFAPKTWKIKRKVKKFVTKPSPGCHKKTISVPLNVVLRDIMGYVTTNKEVEFIVREKNVFIDDVKRKTNKFPVGLFDVLSLKDINEHFRIVLDEKGRINVIKIKEEESGIKPYQITGKKIIKGETQLNFFDGRNMIVKKDTFKIGDTLLIEFDEKNPKIKKHVKLEKNSLIYLTGGERIGQTGKIQDIMSNKIIYKNKDGNVVETLKKFAFPIGKEKAIITLT